jgi:hypothetical protein
VWNRADRNYFEYQNILVPGNFLGRVKFFELLGLEKISKGK